MKKAYIHKIVDYTLKRKGDIAYDVVDENKNHIHHGFCWKTKKAAMERIQEMGLEFAGMFVTHQNYSHWQDFQIAE